MLTTGLRWLTEIAWQVLGPAIAESQVQRPIHYSGRSHIEDGPISNKCIAVCKVATPLRAITG